MRNLQVGKRVGEAWGSWVAVGYSPDAFGHPETLPSILRGFGISRAVVWRGYGGEPGQEGDLFRWRGPDGSEVLTYHLPPDGYEFGAELPTETGALLERWKRVRTTLADRATGGAVLVTNGADHHELQPGLQSIVARLQEIEPDLQVRFGTLDDFFLALDGTDAPVVTGELRHSPRYAWALQGTLATRSGLKRRIAEGEHLLVRWLEPQAALAGAMPDMRAAVEQLWREHLTNCAHDVLCGCHADTVAREAEVRAAGVIAGAQRLLTEAVRSRRGGHERDGRDAGDLEVPRVTVVNPSPRAREGVAEVVLMFHRSDVVVGRPAAASTTRLRRNRPSVSCRGRAVPSQVLERYLAYDRRDRARAYPDQDIVEAVRVAVLLNDVPGMGGVTLAVTEAGGGPPSSPAPVRGVRGGLEGEGVGIRSTRRSGFELRDRATQITIRDVGAMVAEEDAGDTYTPEPTGRATEAIFGRGRLVTGGPLTASVARDFAVRGTVEGTVYARLDAATRLARFVVEGNNRGDDHRLRFRIPAPAFVARDGHWADMAFGPTRRGPTPVIPEGSLTERPLPTAPMQRFVLVPLAVDRHLLILTRGIFEYEAADGRVDVTLYRATGELSRADLVNRPGHAGWPQATPRAQEHGPFRCELGIVVVAGEAGSPALWAEVETFAEAFHHPLTGFPDRGSSSAPDRLEGPVLRGDGLAFSALKAAEDGRGTILRCVNMTAGAIEGAWHLPTSPEGVWRCRLDETDETELEVTSDDVVRFTAAPRGIVTIRVVP